MRVTTPDLPIVEGPLRTERLTVFRLAVLRPGAPKVLLLGGSNFDLRLKRSFLQSKLAQSCDLVTFEPRGIGRTEQPDGPWSMDDYVKDAVSIIDALGWEQAHIVGESFGGMTALHLAAYASERVASLTVSAATAGGPDHASYDVTEFLHMPVEEAAEAALCLQDTRNQVLREADAERFAKELFNRITFETAFRNLSAEGGGYARLLEARRHHDATGILSKVTTPTTVVAGRFDQQARPEAQRALADALPNAAFHIFDAGHGVLFSAPEASDLAVTAIETTGDAPR